MVSQEIRRFSSEDKTYLATVGNGVKRLRARRGMSRRILAQSSGVSERYLAELESGKGNISILRLRRIADAMSVPVEDLVCDRAVDSPSHAFLLEYVRQADPEELVRLHKELSARNRGGREGRRLIALIGLRGAGKSTIGKALAATLTVPFIELVGTIEERAGMEVNEIFSLGGQPTYRRLERQCLEEAVSRRDRAVLAVGGSLVSEPMSYERLLDTCITIWLRAIPEDHMARVIAQGDSRPMAGSPRAMEDLKRILGERESLYGRSDYAVDTSGRSLQETLDEILELPLEAEIVHDKKVA